MPDNIYAYILTDDEQRDEAIGTMLNANVPRENIYIDKDYALDGSRPQFGELTNAISSGDVLLVRNFDDLGADFSEVMEHWATLVDGIGADIVLLEEPVMDTRYRRDIVGRYASEVMFAILRYASRRQKDDERLRRERRNKNQREKIHEAQGRGIKFGRPRKTLPSGMDEVFDRYKSKDLTLSDAVNILGVSRNTFYRRYNEYKARVGSK